jgi:hypothetical protein
MMLPTGMTCVTGAPRSPERMEHRNQTDELTTTEQEIRSTTGTVDMKKFEKRGWRWAYTKVRSLYCSRLTAIYRATLFALRGDTGRFWSHSGMMQSRLKR